jgi:DNA-binding LacI/PurR family transcriptional regulator
MEARIAVASATFAVGFAGQVYSHLKKNLRPGQTIVECTVPPLGGPEFIRARLMAPLESEPKPVALIGICFRPDPGSMEAFRAVGAPVVLIDEEAEGASTVGFDSFVGGYIAGQHLARAGRKSIAVVSGAMQVNGGYNAVQRVKGFAKAMSEAGLPFRMEDVVEVVDYTRRDGVNALARILDERRKVDAVFSAAGDATATGILATARERRLKVPEQLAVLGYDDSPMAAISDPPLSTIRQSADTVAVEALKLATTAEALTRPTRLLLEPKLVLRQSA